MTPVLKVLEKIVPVTFYKISKNVFRENAKTRQNLVVFDDAVMGVNGFSGSLFCDEKILQTSGFISKQN